MGVLYYLGEVKELFRMANKSPEPKKTATQRLQWFSGPQGGHSPVPPLYVHHSTRAFSVRECVYVNVCFIFFLASLQIQAKSVVSWTLVFGLKHLQQTCSIFIVYIHIQLFMCESALENGVLLSNSPSKLQMYLLALLQPALCFLLGS